MDNKYKYITVKNMYTRQAVPFKFSPEGEIIIMSTNPLDNDETCVVVMGNIFYEYSLDFESK